MFCYSVLLEKERKKLNKASQTISLLFDGYMQNNMVSVTSILGGASDNTGSSISRRLGKLNNVVVNCFFFLLIQNG